MTTPSETPNAARTDPAYQAYMLLRIGFVVAPILAGLDKFLHFLVPAGWEQYLAPFIGNLVGADPFLLVVGAIEIGVGIGVAIKPQIFAYVLSAWLVGIIISLLLNPASFDGAGWGLDIALRDLGLAIGAFALGRLSQIYAR